MVAAKYPWEAFPTSLEEIGVEFEIDKHNVACAKVQNTLTQQEFDLISYYSHPEARLQTARDLARCTELAVAFLNTLIVGGDFNNAEVELENDIGYDYLVDAAEYWATQTQQAPHATYYGQ